MTDNFVSMANFWKAGPKVKSSKMKPIKIEKKKNAKKANKVKAVEDMTAGERAQYEAGKVANRLYRAKAKAPKYA